NLLDVTGIETGRLRFAKQPFDLRQAVDAAIDATEALRQEKGQSLVLQLPDNGAMRAEGDVRRVGRAVEQLLENASKFCSSGTLIGVSASAQAEGRYQIFVCDQGGGIPAADAARIFEPF